MKEDYLPLEKLLGASNGSIYKLTVLAAKRALQLADGDKVLVEKAGERLLDSALTEIAQGKIKARSKGRKKE